MTYRHFAYLYDELMEDAPYEEWLHFFLQTIERYSVHVETVLDVGCGTGAILLKLAEAGFKPTGIDLSSDMLTVAQEKLSLANKQVPLLEQNMTEASRIGLFDAIVVFCDSLNYLETEEELNQAFCRFYEQLNDGGLLLFDVHSIYKVEQIFTEAVFAHDGDDISYIWKSFQGEHPYSVEHELTFFVQQKNGLYERVEELHKQRTYPIETYTEMLDKHKFQLLEVSADFQKKGADFEESERIFFVAKKGIGTKKEK